MGYSAKVIANHFLKTYGRQHGISPLKLQKLVYLAHGWHLALHDEALVTDEDAEAWQHGPVFPSLYHEFSEFGRGAITRLAEESVHDAATGVFRKTIPAIPKGATRVRSLLDRIWDVHGKYSPWQLSAMTHKPDSPWAKTRQQSGGKNNANITDATIKAHYKNLMAMRTGRDG